MSTQNPFSQLFSQNDFTKLFDNYQSLPFDMNGFLETQRKNIQALNEAQKLTIENLQTIAQRQSEILSEIVENQSNITKGFIAEGSPEDKISKNAEMFKAMYERSIKNMNEISEIINQSNKDASTLINKRVAATMNEIQDSLQKTQKKAA